MKWYFSVPATACGCRFSLDCLLIRAMRIKQEMLLAVKIQEGMNTVLEYFVNSNTCSLFSPPPPITPSEVNYFDCTLQLFVQESFAELCGFL